MITGGGLVGWGKGAAVAAVVLATVVGVMDVVGSGRVVVDDIEDEGLEDDGAGSAFLPEAPQPTSTIVSAAIAVAADPGRRRRPLECCARPHRLVMPLANQIWWTAAPMTPVACEEVISRLASSR